MLAAALAVVALLAALAATPALAETDAESVPPPNGTTELQATRAADASPDAEKERRENGSVTSTTTFKEGHWQVAYFADDEEVAQLPPSTPPAHKRSGRLRTTCSESSPG